METRPGDTGASSWLLNNNENNAVGSWLLGSNGDNGAGSWLLTSNENNVAGSWLRSSNGWRQWCSRVCLAAMKTMVLAHGC